MRFFLSLTQSIQMVTLLSGCLIFIGCTPKTSSEKNLELHYTIEECQGCHFSERTKEQKTYSSGLKHWTDEQCFGCHQEIHDVAKSVQHHKKDDRIITVGVSKKRLMEMKDHPLPYLNTPENPIEASKHLRFNQASLLRFLKQPSGVCHTEGCRAPKMMAYPNISAQDLAKINFFAKKSLPKELREEQQGQVPQGKKLFSQICTACHQTSTLSGYNAVGLSAFSAQWIYLYVQGKVTHKTPRVMPKFSISKQDSHNLYAFFQSKRKEQSQKLHKSVQTIKQSWEALPSTPVDKQASDYFEKHFWRDGGCVHCHAGDGRAGKFFDMRDDASTHQWLTTANSYQLYERLMIKKYEQKHGLGYQVPGMPMTGSALPDRMVQYLGQWLKNQCVSSNKNCQPIRR
tara:strand:+ start:1275 stop:2474 length:1200 start_codon:yes stop_codon:yes gene_type:complete